MPRWGPQAVGRCSVPGKGPGQHLGLAFTEHLATCSSEPYPTSWAPVRRSVFTQVVMEIWLLSWRGPLWVLRLQEEVGFPGLSEPQSFMIAICLSFSREKSVLQTACKLTNKMQSFHL